MVSRYGACVGVRADAMTASGVAAVLVHVPDVPAALAWYQRAFPHAIRRRIEAFDFDCLTVGDISLEMVAVGATLYRGPLDIEDGQRMFQVRDPWGNCIGLRGLG